MKKTFVVLLILAVAGGVFAQELKWSGVLKTGVQFYADNEKAYDDDARDPGFKLYSDDADRNGGRLDLTATYTNNNVGVKANLRNEYLTTLSFNNAYGWIDFIDGKLNVKAGKIDDGVWRGGGDQNFNISTGYGVRFEIKPIEGLNFGAFLTGPNSQAHQYSPKEGYAPIGDFLSETAIGVSYTADAFDVSAGLKLDGDDNSGYIGQDDFTGVGGVKGQAVANEAKGGINAYIGFNLKAVENLTATIEAAFNHLGNFSGNPSAGTAVNPEKEHTFYEDVKGTGSIWANENIGYQISDPLGVGLLMHQFIYGGKVDSDADGANAAYNPELRFTPYVNYAISDALTVGLKGTYTVKADWYDLKLDIKPNLSFKVAPNATINAYYNLGIADETKYAIAAGKSYSGTNSDPDSVTSHTVQIDLIWTF
jgi:hypothetical protein